MTHEQQTIIDNMMVQFDRQYYGMANADWQGWQEELDKERESLPLVTPMGGSECLCIMPMADKDNMFQLQVETVRIDDYGNPEVTMQWIVSAPFTTSAELEEFIRLVQTSYMKNFIAHTQGVQS